MRPLTLLLVAPLFFCAEAYPTIIQQQAHRTYSLNYLPHERLARCTTRLRSDRSNDGSDNKHHHPTKSASRRFIKDNKTGFTSIIGSNFFSIYGTALRINIASRIISAIFCYLYLIVPSFRTVQKHFLDCMFWVHQFVGNGSSKTTSTVSRSCTKTNMPGAIGVSLPAQIGIIGALMESLMLAPVF